MGLSKIIGQDRAVGLLRAAFESGRLSHAYLFHGPDGVGKERTALEFAASLNCEKGALSGCGECPSCKMAAKLSHPDVHLIFPTPRDMKPAEESWVLEGYATEGHRHLRAWDDTKRPPASRGDRKLDREKLARKHTIISVETILTRLVAKANQRPYVGPWKVFVLADADMMTAEAANTLLKTLEEPPEMTVIVLTTSRLAALPATVVSRCQKIQFARLTREAVEEILVADDRLGFDRARARSAAALSGGSAGEAVRIDRSGFEAELDKVAAIMKGERARDPGSLLDEAEALAFRLGRADQQRVLDLMLLWLRDVLRLSNARKDGARPEIVYSRHADALERQARALDLDATEPLIRKIDDARRAIERYSNPTIVFTSVLLDIAIARAKATPAGKASHAA